MYQALEDDTQPPCQIYHLLSASCNKQFVGEQGACHICQVEDCLVPEIIFTTSKVDGIISEVASSRDRSLLELGRMELSARGDTRLTQSCLTVDLPEDCPLLGAAAMLQARVCRARRKTSSSSDNALELGEAVPFLEYELHQQVAACLLASPV